MDFNCITSCKRSTISALSLCSRIHVQDFQEKITIPSIRVSLSFLQKHLASPAHKGLKLAWVTTSWVEHRASTTSQSSLPRSCCRQHLTTPRSKPFSLAASSSSLSNKFREGIAAGEFQRSAKACSHKLHIWSRQHHLPGTTSLLPPSLSLCPAPDLGGALLSNTHLARTNTCSPKNTSQIQVRAPLENEWNQWGW